MRKKRFLISAAVITLLLVLAVVLFMQVDFSNDENLDAFIERKMESLNAVGMAVAVIRRGEVFWAGNYGYADRESGRKVTEETIFNVASVSKTVTGVAIMQLVEQGLVDLDQSISTYLPLEITNPRFPEAELTIRMLLQHKSSLMDNESVMKGLYTIESGLADSDVSLERFARGYFLPGGQWYDPEQNFSRTRPGDQYHYTNAGYGLLGLVVEQVSGQMFNDYCETHIFLPLDMDSAGWLSTDVDPSRMAIQYDDGVRLKPYSYPTYPDGSLKVSLRDYAKFLTAVLNGGSYRGRRILQESSVMEMLPADPAQNLAWAENVLDEFMIDSQGQSVAGHTGGDPGSFALVAFNSERDTALILFVSGTPSRISFRILNLPMLISRLAETGGLI